VKPFSSFVAVTDMCKKESIFVRKRIFQYIQTGYITNVLLKDEEAV
jgi:hypothetical protein